MKVVILAGGKGTRLSEFTKLIPKPMLKIKNVPIIVRIINYYNKFGFDEFIIATGYKKNVIENFFKKKFKKIENSNCRYWIKFHDWWKSENIKKILK